MKSRGRMLLLSMVPAHEPVAFEEVNNAIRGNYLLRVCVGRYNETNDRISPAWASSAVGTIASLTSR